MWEKIRVIFTIPELRNKIFLTLILLAIFRLGHAIPLPMVDVTKMKANLEQSDSVLGGALRQAAIFSGSDLDQASIFGLGIMPYISASIIFQILATVWGPLERLQKEGESGRKKINEYTRYATVFLCIGQSWGYVAFAKSFILPEYLNANGSLPFSWQFTLVMIMTAGTIFMMWIGEQIDEYGIGNGISLLIMAGILARMPHAGYTLIAPVISAGQLELSSSGAGQVGLDTFLMLAVLFCAVIAGVIYITQGQRRIPTQSAKHVRGRRVFGGGNRQYLPLRINQAGVMPIIFASSLLLFPTMIFRSLAAHNSFWSPFEQAFHRESSFVYNLMYVLLIYFFCYFWTAISFNPKDMSENLKNYGSFIPGYRPGRRTADYLEKVMVRITYVGAGFLAVIAVLPTMITSWLPVDMSVASFYGGTSLLIAVSVAFDLVQKIDSHLVMRNYKGLLEKG